MKLKVTKLKVVKSKLSYRQEDGYGITKIKSGLITRCMVCIIHQHVVGLSDNKNATDRFKKRRIDYYGK